MHWKDIGGRFLLVLLTAASLAIRPEPAAAKTEWSGGLWAGLRRDQVDFNISGGVGGPNILSELTWDDLEIWQIGAAGRLRLQPRHFPVAGLVRLRSGLGVIAAGENRDSDYLGDNRTLEFSRSDNQADGEVYDVSIGTGPEFTLRSGRLRLAPLVGYAVHAQNLNMSDGYQTLSAPTDTVRVPETGPFPGLDSSYDTLWYGFWTGVETSWRPFARLVLSGGVELHLVDYYAEADWNLRSDFAHPKSFEHRAWGAGIEGRAGVAYETEGRWAFRLEYAYRHWQADQDGRDRVYFADGSVSETVLNEANWYSQSLSLGIDYRF